MRQSKWNVVLVTFAENHTPISKPNNMLKTRIEQKLSAFVVFSGNFSQNLVPHVFIKWNF